MPNENRRKSSQASRDTSKLKPCGELLARMIGLLRKLPLDTRLTDLRQNAAIRNFRSENLSVSARVAFATRPRPYPYELMRSASRQRPGGHIFVSESDWSAAEAERVAVTRQALKEEELDRRRKYQEIQLAVLSEVLSGLTPEFVEHVMESKQPAEMTHQDIDRAVRRYDWFRFHHDFMRSLVQAAHSREKGREIQLPDALPSGAYIDSSGRFRPRLAPIIKALDLAEVDRIRICANKNCRRIFWAGRIAKPGSEKNDQVCCSPECSHASRNQRLRARYVDPKDDFAERKLTANEKWVNKRSHPKGE